MNAPAASWTMAMKRAGVRNIASRVMRALRIRSVLRGPKNPKILARVKALRVP